MGGFSIGYTKSEFFTVTSSGTTDFQPVDLGGALQTVLSVDASSAQNGSLTNDPYAGSSSITLTTAMTQPLVVGSTDDRLYWVSEGAGDSILTVWVIRG